MLRTSWWDGVVMTEALQAAVLVDGRWGYVIMCGVAKLLC